MKSVDPVAQGLRVKARREKLGLTQTEVAKAVGYRQQTIVEIEAGGTKRPGRLPEIATVLKTTREWLAYEEGPEEPLSASQNTVLTTVHRKDPAQGTEEQNARIAGPVTGFVRIPLRGQSMGGKSGSLIFQGDENLGDILAPPMLAGVPGAYAVYVIGDSMLERFRHGEVVYVHPHMPVRRGDDCVVQIQMPDGERHGWVKRFVSMDQKELKLAQLHPKKALRFPRKTVISVHKIVFSGPVG